MTYGKTPKQEREAIIRLIKDNISSLGPTLNSERFQQAQTLLDLQSQIILGEHLKDIDMILDKKLNAQQKSDAQQLHNEWESKGLDIRSQDFALWKLARYRNANREAEIDDWNHPVEDID